MLIGRRVWRKGIDAKIKKLRRRAVARVARLRKAFQCPPQHTAHGRAYYTRLTLPFNQSIRQLRHGAPGSPFSAAVRCPCRRPVRRAHPQAPPPRAPRPQPAVPHLPPRAPWPAMGPNPPPSLSCLPSAGSAARVACPASPPSSASAGLPLPGHPFGTAAARQPAPPLDSPWVGLHGRRGAPPCARRPAPAAAGATRPASPGAAGLTSASALRPFEPGAQRRR